MTFSTNDLAFAAYAFTEGYEPTRITSNGSTTGRPGATFFFEDLPPEIRQSFFSGTARVSPSAFHQAIRHLRNEMDKALSVRPGGR